MTVTIKKKFPAQGVFFSLFFYFFETVPVIILKKKRKYKKSPPTRSWNRYKRIIPIRTRLQNQGKNNYKVIALKSKDLYTPNLAKESANSFADRPTC